MPPADAGFPGPTVGPIDVRSRGSGVPLGLEVVGPPLPRGELAVPGGPPTT